jgi:hypothetical protein
MGSLATYLQAAFVEQCPPGWTCHTEAHLLARDLEQVLGYSSRVDLLMERTDAPRRLWIEFEVSRADPVANHAKFAVAHLFQPQLQTDTFVSMVSPHVDIGRSHLAANTIVLLRHLGMNAFQTILFPQMTATEIKRLNRIKKPDLAREAIPVQREIERVLTITAPVIYTAEHQIHFVGNLLEVMLNLRRWNEEIATPEGAAAWGRRTITYFVFDSRSRLFAPSKFCAYLVITPVIEPHTIRPGTPARSEMTIARYNALDASEPIFDGQRAHAHLRKHLAMTRHGISEVADEVARAFEAWFQRHAESVAVHPQGPVFILPPVWFR